MGWETCALHIWRTGYCRSRIIIGKRTGNLAVAYYLGQFRINIPIIYYFVREKYTAPNSYKVKYLQSFLQVNDRRHIQQIINTLSDIIHILNNLPDWCR